MARLELHEGELSRAVLRGGGGGNATPYPASRRPPQNGPARFNVSQRRSLLSVAFGTFGTLLLEDTTGDERSGGVTLPTLFNPYDPQYIADPHAFYARLRGTAPVQRATLPDGQGVWLLSLIHI